MKIVTPHRTPDFDGFASAYAFKKINPEFEIVVSGRFQQNLEEFLRLFEFKYFRDVEINENLKELVLVDTASLDRVGSKILEKVTDDTKIVAYDHHPKLKLIDEKIEVNSFEIGAITSYFVLKIKENGIDISPEEATLFLIAIYEDTGNFLYDTTSAEDLEAAKFLLENGARLDWVQEFISFELNSEQKELLHLLSENVETFNVYDYKIAIAKAEIEKFIGGLNVITYKLWEFEDLETLIVVVRMGKKVFLVGRTKNDDISIKKIMQYFGGNGHEKAGSATLQNVSLDEVIYKLKNVLPKFINFSKRAKDIMTSPVRTVFTHESIGKVYEMMNLTGHGGFPIIEGNKLVGIVTRKAVDKAMRHGFSDRPVKSIMTTSLVTVYEDDPVFKVKKLMLENDVGRIPVLNKNNILVGIITRSDLLNLDEKELKKGNESTLKFEDVKHLMVERIPSRILNLLRLIGSYGEDKKMPVYVVGGFVRDLLLGLENYDIDIVVEGNGLEFAKYASKQLGAKMVEHEKFLTASLFFKDGFRIDIATARTEYYEKPADLPQVDISTIKKDLYRRDFTINAMAIKLNTKEFGLLYDFFDSRKDLKEGLIRVLHKLSFVEDPTRIIRAVRFEQRFGFKIEEETLRILNETLNGGFLEKVSGQRIRQELEKILGEREPLNAIKRLAQLKILKHIFPKTYFTSVMEKKLENLFNNLSIIKELYKKVNVFYSLLRILLEYYDIDTLKKVIKKYGIPKKFIDEIKATETRLPPLLNMIKYKIRFSDIYKVIGKPSAETTAHIMSYIDDEDSKEYFVEYLKRVFSTKLSISGNYLKEKMNVKNSVEIGKFMNELYCRKLDNPSINEEEELKKILEDET
ncbi:polyA polymerase [Thermosipho africanus Ob7]|uniref:CBS domain-containing protein n=1 Tax=Thermosipho africanus TaxID=2421 RepID=UPI000E09F4EA|nr:CBS domain-containing protein [Thermosipho africanus]RDI92055.1 polyA polymerase [Thermosipho africanus Ob7]